MDITVYWTCAGCGHVEPRSAVDGGDPEHCELCRSPQLRWFDDIDEAEDFSESVLAS